MIEEIKKYAENLNEVYALEQEMGQYQYLIDIGNKAPSFTKEEQNELNKMFGCQAQVWIISKFDNNRFYFRGDSDAAIVKGLETLAELFLLGRENVDWKVLKRLRYQLVVAGTALRLRKVKLRWDKIHFDLSLAMFASMVAKSGFIGSGVIRICGLKTFLTSSLFLL